MNPINFRHQIGTDYDAKALRRWEEAHYDGKSITFEFVCCLGAAMAPPKRKTRKEVARALNRISDWVTGGENQYAKEYLAQDLAERKGHLLAGITSPDDQSFIFLEILDAIAGVQVPTDKTSIERDRIVLFTQAISSYLRTVTNWEARAELIGIAAPALDYSCENTERLIREHWGSRPG